MTKVLTAKELHLQKQRENARLQSTQQSDIVSDVQKLGLGGAQKVLASVQAADPLGQDTELQSAAQQSLTIARELLALVAHGVAGGAPAAAEWPHPAPLIPEQDVANITRVVLPLPVEVAHVPVAKDVVNTGVLPAPLPPVQDVVNTGVLQKPSPAVGQEDVVKEFPSTFFWRQVR